jgi:hypothetical protein
MRQSLPAHPVAEPGDLWVQRCGSPFLFDRVKKLGLLAYRELDDVDQRDPAATVMDDLVGPAMPSCM